MVLVKVVLNIILIRAELGVITTSVSSSIFNMVKLGSEMEYDYNQINVGLGCSIGRHLTNDT